MRVFDRSRALSLAVVLAAAGGLTLPRTGRAQAPPPQTEAGAASAGVVDGSQQRTLYANAHPYMDDALPALEQRVPELKGLRAPEEKEPGSAPGPGGGEDPLPPLLARLGANLDQLVQKIPDLVADEEVLQAEWVSGAKNAPDCSRGPECAGGSVPEKRQNFHYLILIHQAPQGRLLEEDRRDRQNRPLQAGSAQPNFRGFVESWVVFSPGNADEARFRYLGEQTIDRHPTFVVAFAQIPGAVPLPGEILAANRTVPMLLQGIAWIGQRDGQIVQLRTDLLEPQLEVRLLRQTSEIRFGPVRVSKLHLTLWLPRSVVVNCEANGLVFEEKHFYSKYHLYRATTRMIVNPRK